ncbi:MAG: glycoside hydrolase family protein [Alphaproteobacteria bacterium]
MQKNKVKKFLIGSALVSGLLFGTHLFVKNKEDQDDKKRDKIENVKSNTSRAAKHNKELFEKCRSKVKMSLIFVENDYAYVYFCGKAWTTGGGLTVLYNADGTYKSVTKKTKVPSVENRDKYMGRYMTFEILKDIEKYVKVPMDEKTMITTCVFRYCIGGKNFKKSKYLKYLNSGKTGAELSKTLTGWREQEGVLNRCYFFAALLEDKIKITDLLDLRCEGCYNLHLKDIVVYEDGKRKTDTNDFCEWNFSNIEKKLEKAKKPRTITLNLANSKKVQVECELVKDVVMDYVLEDVKESSDKSHAATFVLGTGAVIGMGIAASNLKKRRTTQKRRTGRKTR